ncbi:MAG TPA: FAD-dependent oxidoreductase, partial [Phycisphaerales bacterium]|nr:FAD-dependent oxidoreductase [Phycisphaerales bacterium]
MKTYDLVVIGSGPGGQKAAIQAAKLGKEVCVIEKMDVVGGVAINTGTIPSKALREAVVDHLSARKALAETRNAGYLAFDRAETLAELMGSCQRVIRAEIDIVRQQFSSNSIDLRRGWGSIAGEGVVSVRTADENTESVRARNILVAVGT